MSRHPIPADALDDRLGFIGTSGSGKTYNAGGAVERLLSRKARVVIVDPLGVWWGLRLLADGKTESKFDVVIFGGPHGDLPLNEHAGALLGETAATMAESCIIDLSQLGTKSAERRFMTEFLETIYRKASGEPFHLVVDEADIFAPQKPPKGDEVLLNRMEQIVRRGRVKGFIPWLISQRPAVLNKNVLSQVDGLVAFKLTATQDRDALDSWIEGQADKDQGKAIKDSLPTLQIGTGVVWIPGRGVLATADFPRKETFDSSRTPKRGEKPIRSAKLKPVDFPALKERMSALVQEAKANDPKELKAQIATLKRELAQKPKAQPVSDDWLKRECDRGWKIGFDQANSANKAAFKAMLDVNNALKSATRLLDKAINEKLAADEAGGAKSNRIISVAPTPICTAYVEPTKLNGDERPLGAERKPLAVLASVSPAGMTEAQWAVAAGLKRTGGTWSTYLSRLRTGGRVIEQGDLWYATESGIADIGADIPVMPSPGMALVDYWASRIPAARPMLKHIAQEYPNWITRDELAEALDLTASAGTFSTYLSRLRSPGLIEEDGEKRIRAAQSLMEG